MNPDLGPYLTPRLLNIVLSYCDGKDEIDALVDIIGDDSKITELHRVSCKVASRFQNLRALSISGWGHEDLTDLQGMRLYTLRYTMFSGQNINPLREMPLRELYLNCYFQSIEPLRGIPLRILNIGNYAGNLSPLVGMQLEELHLGGINVDFGILRGMPLRKLIICEFNGNLESLRGMQLEELDISSYMRCIGPLRGMPLRMLRINIFAYGIDVLLGMPLQLLVLAGHGRKYIYKTEDGSLQKYLDNIAKLLTPPENQSA